MKKGSETLMFTFATIGLIIVLFFAWFVFVGFGSDEKIEQELVVKRQLTNNLVLMNVLKSPVEMDGYKGNVADLIVDSYYEDDYQELGETARKILDPLYLENRCYKWNLELKLMPDDKKIKSIINKERIGAKPITDSSTLIPLLDNSNKKIMVRLYEEC